MSGAPPERYSRRPLPAHRYRPGRTPHPERDPRGHAHEASAPDFAPLDPADWHRCEAHLFAVDLFNHGYWWEAHEVWESLWREFERGETTARFLQGLIQLCASELKREQGLARAADDLRERAAARLRAADGPHLGIDPSELLAQTPSRVDSPVRIRLRLEA